MQKNPCLCLWQLPTMWGIACETASKDLIFFSILNSLNELAAEARLMQRVFSGNFSELWTRIYLLIHPSCLGTVWESLQLQVIFSIYRNWIYTFLGAQNAIAATGIHTDISMSVLSSTHPSLQWDFWGACQSLGDLAVHPDSSWPAVSLVWQSICLVSKAGLLSSSLAYVNDLLKQMGRTDSQVSAAVCWYFKIVPTLHSIWMPPFSP